MLGTGYLPAFSNSILNAGCYDCGTTAKCFLGRMLKTKQIEQNAMFIAVNIIF